MVAITTIATKAIEENGGSVGADINWPAGTELVSSSDRGAWGNFSYREWMLPDGRCICWDSDEREYQLAYRRDPITKQVIKRSTQ